MAAPPLSLRSNHISSQPTDGAKLAESAVLQLSPNPSIISIVILFSDTTGKNVAWEILLRVRGSVKLTSIT